jgi:hypothetical protein
VVTVKSRAGSPTVEVEIAGTQREFILDTGSGISLIQTGVYCTEEKPTNLSPFSVTGKELDIKGVQDVLIHLGGKKFSHQFCVCSLATEADGILGMDFFAGKKADLNLEKLQLGLFSGTEQSHGLESQNTAGQGKDQSRSPYGLFETKWGMQSRRTSRESQEIRGKVRSGK